MLDVMMLIEVAIEVDDRGQMRRGQQYALLSGDHTWVGVEEWSTRIEA